MAFVSALFPSTVAHGATQGLQVQNRQRGGANIYTLGTGAQDTYASANAAHGSTARHAPSARTRTNVAKAYGYTAGGLGILATSAWAAGHTALLAHPIAAPLASSLAAIAGFAFSHAQGPNSRTQIASWAVSCALLGAGLAAQTLAPAWLLINTAVATAALLVALTASAYALPGATVKSWAGVLTPCVTGLAALALVQLVLPAHLGLAAVASGAQLYLGAVAFSAAFVVESRQVWDKARQRGDQFSPATESITIMLSVLNLAVRMQHILALRDTRTSRR